MSEATITESNSESSYGYPQLEKLIGRGWEEKCFFSENLYHELTETKPKRPDIVVRAKLKQVQLAKAFPRQHYPETKISKHTDENGSLILRVAYRLENGLEVNYLVDANEITRSEWGRETITKFTAQDLLIGKDGSWFSVKSLLETVDCDFNIRVAASYSWSARDKLAGPPIREVEDVYALLHELGHIVSPERDRAGNEVGGWRGERRATIQSERGSWAVASQLAKTLNRRILLNLDYDEMRKYMDRALESREWWLLDEIENADELEEGEALEAADRFTREKRKRARTGVKNSVSTEK